MVVNGCSGSNFGLVVSQKGAEATNIRVVCTVELGGDTFKDISIPLPQSRIWTW